MFISTNEIYFIDVASNSAFEQLNVVWGENI